MASSVEICNMALGWLGADFITSFDDDSASAQLCKLNYPILRDAVLEERDWTFAITRRKLVRVSEDPPYGFDAWFQIPVDILRVIDISRAGDVEAGTGTVPGVYGTSRTDTGRGRESPIPWNREGDRIACSGASEIYLRGIARIEDTTKFSSLFTQALAARIAMELAISITESRSMYDTMASMYLAKLGMAATHDGKQGRSEKTRSNSLLIVR